MSDQILSNPVISIGVVVQNFGAVLLVKRGVDDASAEWQLPSARLQWQESMPDAVKRIVLQQSGISVNAGGIIQAYDLISDDDHIVMLDFEADFIEGDLKAADDLFDVAWASGIALKTMVVEENTAELLGDLGII